MEQRRSRREAQAAATREQLVVAARSVFAERGYQATTIGAITAEAATAHGTFYLYFRNKEDVFTTVLDDLVLELYDRTWVAAPGASMRDVLDAGVRSFLEVFARNAGIWRSLVEGAFTTPAVESLWRELRGGFISRVARWLHEIQAEGGIRDLDPDLAANALGGMVEWAATTHFVLRIAPGGEPSVDDVARSLADLWYHSLALDVDARH